MTWPVAGPTSIQNTIPSYLYTEYNDDVALAAFVQAYNIYAQAYVDWFNGVNLPIYTGGIVAGPLLDWVATNLYGLARPGLPTRGLPGKGPFNTYIYNTLTRNFNIPAVPDTFTATSDDTYRRCLTWLFFKGDGKTFTPRWIKRRIARFLHGMNGVNYNIDQTYDISVAPTGFKTWTITLATSAEAKIFFAAVAAGVLELPCQITWTVTLV